MEGGLSDFSRISNISNRASTSLGSGKGFIAGVTLRQPVRPWLYLTLAPGLIQKGYTLNRTDSLFGEFENFRDTYVQLPVGLAFYHAWGRLGLFADAGLYAGYWMYGRVKGRAADIFSVTEQGGGTEQFTLRDYSAPYAFLPSRDERWEWGGYLGLEGSYRLKGNWGCTAACRYFTAFNSQERNNPAYNQAWAFSLGIQRSISKAKHGP